MSGKIKISVFGISFLFFLLLSIFSCNGSQLKIHNEVNHDEIAYQNPNDSLPFYKVKKHIQKNGKHERVSVSSIASDTSLMVDYYSIISDNWEITIDHTNRIYFSKDKVHYGNVILQSDSVFVEPYYLGPKESIDTLNEIIKPINEVYISLIKSIN